jgi:hypothetical protein
MPSPVANLAFSAALLALPLSVSAQIHLGVPDRTTHLTLLPGPTLTAPVATVLPAPTLASPTRTHIRMSQRWFVSSVKPDNFTDQTPSLVQLLSQTPNRTPGMRTAEAEFRIAQTRLEEAEKLRELRQAERNAARVKIEQLKETQRKAMEGDPMLLPTKTPSEDSLRVDAKPESTPTNTLSNPGPGDYRRRN